jgi:hypothetical protein
MQASDPDPISASLVAGIIGMKHYAWTLEVYIFLMERTGV